MRGSHTSPTSASTAQPRPVSGPGKFPVIVHFLVGSFDVPGPPDGAEHRFKETPKKTIYSSKGATFDGAKQIVLRAADEGKSVVKMKGIGASLPTPTLPLLTPVVAQLHGENGVCFEGTYSAPTRNDALLFRAKLD